MLNKKILASLLCLSGLSSLVGYNAHAAQTMTPINFHDSRESREWNIIDGKLYHNFITGHPDVQVVSDVIDLDGKGVGSIITQFRSPSTCNTDGCVTTVVSYNPKTKTWKEILNHRTNSMWIGGPSPTTSGANMKQFVTSDGLLWRWIGKDTYYADLRSVSKLWPDNSTPTYGARKRFVEKNLKKFSEYIDSKTSNGDIFETPITLNGIGGQYLMVYNQMSICSAVLGCPFMIIQGDSNNNYKIIANGTYSGLGGTITSDAGKDNYNPIVVQFGNSLDFYKYDGNYYQLYKTTYPSKVTRTP